MKKIRVTIEYLEDDSIEDEVMILDRSSVFYKTFLVTSEPPDAGYVHYEKTPHKTILICGDKVDA